MFERKSIVDDTLIDEFELKYFTDRMNAESVLASRRSVSAFESTYAETLTTRSSAVRTIPSPEQITYQTSNVDAEISVSNLTQSRNASRRSKSQSPERSNVETSDANLTRSESPGRYSNLEASLRSFDETVQSSRSSRRRRRTRELSSSSDETSMTRQQSRSREKWYEQPKPLDNADASLCDKIWPFGLNLIKRSCVAAGRDYWSVIRPLINDEVMRARNGQSHSYTWQTYDKNGHLYTDFRGFTRKVSSTQGRTSCFSPISVSE